MSWFLNTLNQTLVTLGLKQPGVESTSATDWSLPLISIDGAPLDPATLRGKVVLVANTASFCGFTKQYAGLQALYECYKDRGLVVLGVPSNDFGGQDPKPNADIKDFCTTRFAISFPLLEKQQVTGPKAHPLYRWAAGEAGPGGAPAWNFHKYLIGRDGRLRAWYPSMVSPQSPRMIRAIEAAL